MELDENLEEVSGKIVNFNRGLGFFSFVKDGTEQICMFRPNKILVDGQKIPASKIKNVEQLNKVKVIRVNMIKGEEGGGLKKGFSAKHVTSSKLNQIVHIYSCACIKRQKK